LESKMERFLQNNNIEELTDLNADLESNFEVDVNEPYPCLSFRGYQAVSKFYEGDFSGAARAINSLRNELSMKKYLFTNVEYKLFQALQYCFQGEDGLCSQLLQSVKRQISEDEELFSAATIFIKMLKAAIKPEEFRKKVKRLTEIYNAFQEANSGRKRILWYVKLDENMLRRLANPIKD
nr:hypothetical protein [Bacteroidia bacterium]